MSVMRNNSFLLIASILFLFLIPSSVNAYYEIKCDFFTTPEKYPTLVTTDSFGLKINLTNIGNRSFPPTGVNVTIFTPDGKVLESYYSFLFQLKNLTINETYSYKQPFPYRPNWFSVYEIPIPGTWEIKLNLLQLPFDDITYTHSNVVRANGECRYYFSVKEFSQYEKELSDYETQKQIRELTTDTKSLTIDIKNLTNNLKNLTIILVFLSFLTIIFNENFIELAKKYRYKILGLEGIGLSIAAFLFIDLLSVLWNRTTTVVGSSIILIISVLLLFQKINYIKKYNLLNSLILMIFPIMLMVNIIFLIFFITNIDMLNPLIVTSGILITMTSIVIIFHTIKEFKR